MSIKIAQKTLVFDLNSQLRFITCNLTMTSVTTDLTFFHRQGIRGQRKLGPISCTATRNEFRQEISALKTTSADAGQLKKAYRKLALRYHPDACDPSAREESTRMFIELQKTYLNLLDQESQEKVCSETRDKWGSQLSELRRRSCNRDEQRDGSWGCRMRAKQHGP